MRSALSVLPSHLSSSVSPVDHYLYSVFILFICVHLRHLRTGLFLFTVSGSFRLSVDRSTSALFHLRRAELELGDLAVRVECRVRQQVGRRLGVAKRDEDQARGDVPVDARGQLNLSPARRDADGPARLDAQTMQVAR